MFQNQSSNPKEKALALFKRCASEVPAYRAFLAERNVNPDEVNGYPAFQKLPLMNKPDYMQAYPLPECCLGGSIIGSG
jgi:phenylacetate-CoA ligase